MGLDEKRQASDAEKLEGVGWVRKAADNGYAEAQYSPRPWVSPPDPQQGNASTPYRSFLGWM